MSDRPEPGALDDDVHVDAGGITGVIADTNRAHLRIVSPGTRGCLIRFG